MKMQQGFTLIELMIVVVIIAIISAIAIPSYQDSVRKANRSDAMNALLDTQQRLERCFTTYGTYMNAACPPAGTVAPGAANSISQHYDITVAKTAATYTLTAVPSSNVQSKDIGKCGSFVLNNTGKKTATGTAAATCW